MVLPSQTPNYQQRVNIKPHEITASLVSNIIHQRFNYQLHNHVLHQIKSHLLQKKRQQMKLRADLIQQQLPSPQMWSIQLASEKGPSSWLIAQPIQQHGFALHKRNFRDALCLMYGWTPLPHTVYACGKQFTIDHALCCPTGRYPTICHNEISNLLASIMTDVCSDVATEPVLQHLSEETFRCRTTSTNNAACLDIHARGFGGNQSECTFFDVRIFSPRCPLIVSTPLPPATAIMSKPNVMCTRREYVKWSMPPSLQYSQPQEEPAHSPPYLKHLCSFLAEKRDLVYSITIGWLQTQLNCSLLTSVIMSISVPDPRWA